MRPSHVSPVCLLTLLGSASLALGLLSCSQQNGGQASAPPAPSQPAPAQPASASQAQNGPLSLAAVNNAQFGASPAGGAPNGASAAGNTASGDNATGDNTTGSNTTAGGGNTSGGGGEASTAEAQPDPALIKAEVLLDRANFAPGVIDGRMGENVKKALVAYEKAHNLPASDTLDQQTWNALTSGDNAPVLKTYTITAQDVAGPWTPDVGEDFVKMSKLPQLGYSSPQEMLAERFHMDQALLKQLNPNADFGKAGTQIVVVDPGQASLPEVASIKVDKATKSVTAMDDSGKVLAVFPATVGSTDRPSPSGTHKVTGVAQNPDYTYDPSKLTWGPKKAGKLRIPPGPHNPVGVVWIALNAPDYGIHGTPDPHLVGKTASHGCVRLTNWDAEELSRAVKPGVKVTFISGGKGS